MDTNGDVAQVLASVDALKRAWQDVINNAAPEEFHEARLRSLRRHAIETGIIERLYEVDWGVTEALVAEGLSSEVAAREGGIDQGALETIRAQFDALSYLSEAAQQEHVLTVTFIRHLHMAICRTQATYEAQDQFGRLIQQPLHHGSWKEQPNFARDRHGGLIEFVPPEHVQSEIDSLIEFDATIGGIHPIIRASWLHYAFVSIHPFEDGNGRVARALSLLALLRGRYAPLVVDRYSRADYIAALDAANHGDLRDLVRLFARLEVVALRSELERPALPPAAASGAVDVAAAYVARLKALRAGVSAERAERSEELAHAASERLQSLLQVLGEDLARQFQELDSRAHFEVHNAEPPDERSHWWKAQILRTSGHGGFFANISSGTWWSYLRLTVLEQQFRYVTVIQKVGQGETGVLALTVLAETVPAAAAEPGSSTPRFVNLLPSSQSESVTFVYTDAIEDRWHEVATVVDRTLAAAIAAFAEGLS
jgi:Fic family protein